MHPTPRLPNAFATAPRSIRDDRLDWAFPVTILLTRPGTAVSPAPTISAAPDALAPKIGSSLHRADPQVHELGLMRRRYGYYWTKLIGAVARPRRLGDRVRLDRRQLVAARLRRRPRGDHDPDRVPRPRRRPPADLQVGPMERLGQPDRRATCSSGSATAGGRASTPATTPTPTRRAPTPTSRLTAIALTPADGTRHRSRLMRWLVAHQGWYFFPILLLEGLSLHADGIRRVVGRDKIERRWVELAFLDRPPRRSGRPRLPRPPAGEGGRVPRRAAGRVRPLHGVARSRRTTSACRWSRRS